MTNTPFIEVFTVVFILTSLMPLINNIITHDNCNYNNNLCPFNSDIDIINYYSKGINYSSLNSSSSYDITFLACVNKFYECGYMLSNNEATNYSSNGVKIGFGVDLGEYNESKWKTLEMPESALEKVKPFFEKKGDDALNELLNTELTLTYDEAYNISLKHITALQQEKIQTIILNEDRLNNTFIITPLLSVLLLQTNETIKSVPYGDRSGYVANTGNYIANLLTNMTIVKQTQSFAFTALDYDNYNSNYNSALVSVVVDTSISKDDFSATYKGELSSIIQRMPFDVALVGYHDDADVIFDFNRNVTLMDDAVDSYMKFEQDVVRVSKGIQRADELFTNKLKDSTMYTKKIIILIMNKESHDDKAALSQMISQYKNEKGYNFIIIGINNVTTNYYEDILNDSSNILYVNDFTQQNQDTTYLPHIIYTSIQRQHIQLQMNNCINNLVIHSIYEPHYFKVNILNASNNKYIIQLNIQNVQDVDYQIYISTKTPYPNINEYDIKHLGNIYTNASSHNATQPYLILLIEDTSPSTTIYISVESVHMIYNITINECDDQYNECNSNKSISNGLYGTNELTEPIGDDNMYYSFANCYTKKCLIDETTLLKYFARGLTIFNTNDNANSAETYINSNLFSCLYSLYYCAYVDQNGKGYIGDPHSIDLNNKESLMFVNEQLPKLLFNKIRPLFIKNDNTTSHKQLLQKENIYFTYDETFYLYNITFQTYIINMNHSLIDCRNCFHKFYQLDINWRFILFMNRFTNENNFGDALELVSNMNSNNYLEWRFKNTENKTKDELFSFHIQSVLLHSLYNGFNEKCLISLIVGKSLMFTSQFPSFLTYLIDSFNEQKISITLYNEDTKRYEMLFDFNMKSDTIIKTIKRYANKTKISKNLNGTLYVDDIIKDEIPRFAHYDKGIKRVILIIGDENFNVVNDTYINHEMKIKKESAFKSVRSKLTKANVNVMLITSKSLEQKHSLTYLNEYLGEFTYDEVFTISNFSHINETHQNISTAIRQFIIPIPMTFEIINDFYASNLYYYEIDLTQNVKFQHLTLSFSSNKINVYYSYNTTYPTKYINDGECSKLYKCDINNNGTNNTKLYITLEPTAKLIYFKAKICEWDSVKERCKNMNDVSIITALVLLVCGFALFVYGTVSCKYGNQNVKKKINIFN